MINLAPALRHVAHRDVQEGVQRLDAQGDATFTQLAALTPGDPAARETIRQLFELFHQLKTAGVPESALYAAHLRVHKESLRLTGEGRPPNWTPDR